MLLPLASEPFTAPADRDMLPSERRTFVRTHRTCVFGYPRLRDGPALSVVYYVPTDDDELLVSTMAGRGKARAVALDPKVSLCVLDERWPFTYLQVYADAAVDRDQDLAVELMMAVGGRMSGEPLGAEALPFVEAMAAEEERVVVRCRPYATFAQPALLLHRSTPAQRRREDAERAVAFRGGVDCFRAFLTGPARLLDRELRDRWRSAIASKFSHRASTPAFFRIPRAMSLTRSHAPETHTQSKSSSSLSSRFFQRVPRVSW